ncbi:MAG: cysteine hydrolase [Lachnospiraceae bacterium]|nr:cysteine hydrolase [Lachnospiraceae bacterium]MBR4605071.1 cysteine hydrolase [Lachnospiraceae bacterium]MBR6152283.1 cysteine hydrolase [Lachnospiraceae bacterium]
MKKYLIVVDMQNDFVTGCLGSKEAQAIVPEMVKYVENFDGTVIFTKDTHGENYMETQEGKKLPVPHCIKNTEGWEIIPELKAIAERSRVYEKPTFGSKELAADVAKEAPDEVTLIGVCTGICVLNNATLIKAFATEIPVKVVASLCACVTPDTHKTALDAMATCQIEIVS